MELALIALIVLMVLGAIVALESRDLLSSIISLGIIGFALTIIFLMLRAPDLAIVQIIIETVTLVILIYAVQKTTRKDVAEKYQLSDKIMALIGVAFVVVFIVVAVRTFQMLPAFGTPHLRMSEYYLVNGCSMTGAANLVAAIILDFRGYDTLGEATVLFASVMGVATILRKTGKKPS